MVYVCTTRARVCAEQITRNILAQIPTPQERRTERSEVRAYRFTAPELPALAAVSFAGPEQTIRHPFPGTMR